VRAVSCRSSIQSDKQAGKPSCFYCRAWWIRRRAEQSGYTSIFKWWGNRKGKGREGSWGNSSSQNTEKIRTLSSL